MAKCTLAFGAPSRLLFAPSVDPLTRNLPGPGVEHELRRLAGRIAFEDEARVVGTCRALQGVDLGRSVVAMRSSASTCIR